MLTASKCRALGRQRRKALSGSQRRKGTRRLNQRLCFQLRNARRVALYFHFDGEPDLLATTLRLLARGTQVYVPFLQKNTMRFVKLSSLKQQRFNRYGIIEPTAHTPHISSKRLQTIVMPLAAYDTNGTRIGMGAGYYDKNLSWRHMRAQWHGPRLIGAAWQCQAMEPIKRQHWDIPLDALVNEHETLNFRKNK